VVATFGLAGLWAHQVGNWRLYRDGRQQVQVAPQTILSGTIDFTALKPDPRDAGKIQLWVREIGDDGWVNTELPIALQQGASWQWPEALPGEVYELQAKLAIDDQIVATGDTVVAVAPATNVAVPLEVNWSHLPKKASTVSHTELGGQVTINGYIPTGSRLLIYAWERPTDTTTIPTVSPALVENTPPIAEVTNPTGNNSWLWPDAIPLKDYEVVAALYYQGRIVSMADQLVIADAGEVELRHVINSTAQRDQVSMQNAAELALNQVLGAVNAPISGTVTIQGPMNNNTSLLMLWRQPGAANYQVVNRYTTLINAGTPWSWAQAVEGQQYQLMAALQVNEQNTSTAPNPITVTAPAANVNFNLNTYYVLPATTGVPVLEACINEVNNNWTAILRIPNMPNAGNYWVQVGNATTTMGNIYDQKFSAGDNSQPMKVQVKVLNGEQHFVQYSYASCDNCQDSNNFAPFSQVVGFTCQ
jgi:hypothetical protein